MVQGKNRRSVLTALNKVLVIDIPRQMRLPITVISNDVQAYFNRIFLWIASLALKRIGLSKEGAFSMTNTLQSSTYDINTAFGISIKKVFFNTPSTLRKWQREWTRTYNMDYDQCHFINDHAG